jgi:hypothetical protein
MSALLYREDFYFVDRFHGYALHSDQYTAGREAHTDFADESVHLTTNNIWNEIVNNSQITGGAENAVLLDVDFFRN